MPGHAPCVARQPAGDGTNQVRLNGGATYRARGHSEQVREGFRERIHRTPGTSGLRLHTPLTPGARGRAGPRGRPERGVSDRAALGVYWGRPGPQSGLCPPLGAPPLGTPPPRPGDSWINRQKCDRPG
ncbi:unnamed protein product [Gadus morhua 'NCC']